MKKTLFSLFTVSLVVILVSCGGSKASKMIGIWKVADVQTDFNEMEVTPEMLSQVIEMQKQTYFRIVDDSTMAIISNNNTYEARWVIDDETNEISYFFNGASSPNILGFLKEDKIINESETPLGAMTIVYEKE